jgi:aspartate ammonia-lyase
MIESAMEALKRTEDEFLNINMGATAIGTGLNSPPGYADLVTQKLPKSAAFYAGPTTWWKPPRLRCLRPDVGHHETGGRADLQDLQRPALDVFGPRCGLNEINLPPMQPGSSIMPGKVNPVIPELVNQVCYQIIGYDAVVSMAAEASELELCMAEPIIAYDLLHGC